MPPEEANLGIRISDEAYGTLLLLHIYKHLFEEGIGLRQLFDYYAFSKHTESELFSKENLKLDKIGLTRFRSDLHQVLQVVFEGKEASAITDTSRKLLEEILLAGNFGKYDERIKHTGNASRHAWEKLKHNARIMRLYPTEVLWEPIFRLYHWLWRTHKLWRWE